MKQSMSYLVTAIISVASASVCIATDVKSDAAPATVNKIQHGKEKHVNKTSKTKKAKEAEMKEESFDRSYDRAHINQKYDHPVIDKRLKKKSMK